MTYDNNHKNRTRAQKRKTFERGDREEENAITISLAPAIRPGRIKTIYQALSHGFFVPVIAQIVEAYAIDNWKEFENATTETQESIRERPSLDFLFMSLDLGRNGWKRSNLTWNRMIETVITPQWLQDHSQYLSVTHPRPLLRSNLVFPRPGSDQKSEKAQDMNSVFHGLEPLAFRYHRELILNIFDIDQSYVVYDDVSRSSKRLLRYPLLGLRKLRFEWMAEIACKQQNPELFRLVAPKLTPESMMGVIMYIKKHTSQTVEIIEDVMKKVDCTEIANMAFDEGNVHVLKCVVSSFTNSGALRWRMWWPSSVVKLVLKQAPIAMLQATAANLITGCRKCRQNLRILQTRLSLTINVIAKAFLDERALTDSPDLDLHPKVFDYLLNQGCSQEAAEGLIGYNFSHLVKCVEKWGTNVNLVRSIDRSRDAQYLVDHGLTMARVSELRVADGNPLLCAGKIKVLQVLMTAHLFEPVRLEPLEVANTIVYKAICAGRVMVGKFYLELYHGVLSDIVPKHINTFSIDKVRTMKQLFAVADVSAFLVERKSPTCEKGARARTRKKKDQPSGSRKAKRAKR